MSLLRNLEWNEIDVDQRLERRITATEPYKELVVINRLNPMSSGAVQCHKFHGGLPETQSIGSGTSLH